MAAYKHGYGKPICPPGYDSAKRTSDHMVSAAPTAQSQSTIKGTVAGLELAKKWHENPEEAYDEYNQPSLYLLRKTVERLCSDLDDSDFYQHTLDFKEEPPHFKPTFRSRGCPSRHLVVSCCDDGSLREHVISGEELDTKRDTIVHTFVDLSPSSGLWDWLKRKVQTKLGRGIPDELIDYFEDPASTTRRGETEELTNFDHAIEIAKKVYGKRNVQEALFNEISPAEKNELRALLQYVCYMVNRGDFKDIPAGSASIQRFYKRHFNKINEQLKTLKPSSAEICEAYRQAKCLGISTLNAKQAKCVLDYDCPPLASAYEARGDRGLARRPELYTLDEQSLRAARHALANVVLDLDDTQLTLHELARTKNLFVMDMQRLLSDDQPKDPGVWFVPLNHVYRGHRKEFAADPELFKAFYAKWSASANDMETNAESLSCDSAPITDKSIVTAAPAVIAIANIAFSDVCRAYERLKLAVDDYLKTEPTVNAVTAVLIKDLKPFHFDDVFISP